MIEAIVRRPVSVIVATLAISTLGLFSLFKLPLSLLPAIERPSLVITAESAAASRDEMLHEVTAPIERRLPSVPGITAIESETTPGRSRIVIESAWQTDPDRLRIDVARRMESAAQISLDELRVETRAADPHPVIEVGVSGASAAARTRFADQVLLPELARVPSAGEVEVVGATPLRITVQPHAAALAARNLTAADVSRRLALVGRSEPAGRAREGASVRPIVVTDRVRSAAELAAIRVGSADDGVPLGEIATVALRVVGDGTAFRIFENGRQAEGVLLRVYRAPGGNAVALARGVRQRVAELSARTPGVRLQVVSDRSAEVTRALAELIFAALAGIFLGTIVLRLVLRDWRPTLALTVVIPVAVLASFSVFHAMGIPIDVVSLAGLALATGLLVDNSIVVLESIATARVSGSRDPVVEGTRQIVVAVIASSLTLIVVFAPLLYLRGLARAVFGEQAVAVVASVSASLLLSLTLTPVLARRLGTGDAAINPGRARYLLLLNFLAGRPRRAFTIALAVTAAAIAAGWLLPRELFAPGAAKSAVMEWVPAGPVDDAASRELSERVWERVLAASDPPKLAKAVLVVPAEDRRAEIEISPRDAERVPELVAGLRRTAATLPEIRADADVRRSTFVEAISGDADQVELIASAPTEREARALEARVRAEALRRELVPVDQPLRAARTALQVDWDEARLASLGIARGSVDEDVKAALGNLDAGRSDMEGADSAIRLLPTAPADLAVIPVRAGSGVAPLGALATIRLVENEQVIDHDEGRPARRLLFRGDAGDWSAFPLSARERLRVAGHAGELDAAYAQMRLAAVLAVILLYLTVAAFYESPILPLLVMAAIPFAAGGGLLSLFLTGQSLNIMSSIGLIFLSGVVVNHTVVLLDRAEQLRRAGAEEERALRQAAADRYRPVMMTTITAILGMLPLALLGGDGVELRRPIAIAVIGGLITATAGTLLLIPLAHRAVFGRRATASKQESAPRAGAPALRESEAE